MLAMSVPDRRVWFTLRKAILIVRKARGDGLIDLMKRMSVLNESYPILASLQRTFRSQGSLVSTSLLAKETTPRHIDSSSQEAVDRHPSIRPTTSSLPKEAKISSRLLSIS